MKWFPRLRTYRGVVHGPLLVLCLVFIAMVCGAVAALIWLIGQFY